MLKQENFEFKLSVSKEGYENKLIAKCCLSAKGAKSAGRSKMAFKEQTLTVGDFINYAINGYAFCNLFKFDENKKYWIKSGSYWNKTYPIYKVGVNKGYFKLSFKSDKFFAGSQTIFVDIDFTKYKEISDYLNSLTYKPTCIYTSYSDKVNKSGIVSRRFRLVYIFDSILNADEFKQVTEVLYNQIKTDTHEPIFDSCGCSYSQYMNGTNSDEVYVTDYIYSATDFIKSKEVIEYTISEKSALELKKIAFTKELVNDMIYMPYQKVVEKWWCKGLKYISKTELDFGGNYYTTNTENYISLFWHKDRVTDGNKRRKKLFMRAAIRRIMKPEITADELLYNLYIDRYRFFDNSDDILDIDCLKMKVESALNATDKELESIKSGYKQPTFVINPLVTDKHTAIAKARTEITDKKIGEYYDINKSVKENLQYFKDNNISISQTRLYKWCNTYSINTKPVKIINGYNPDLSIRENMKVMNCTKYQVEKAKKEYEQTI